MRHRGRKRGRHTVNRILDRLAEDVSDLSHAQSCRLGAQSQGQVIFPQTNHGVGEAKSLMQGAMRKSRCHAGDTRGHRGPDDRGEWVVDSVSLHALSGHPGARERREESA